MTETNPFEPPKSTGVSPAENQERDGKLIVLATFDNGPEAHCLRSELESEGISASVANEHSSQVIGASLFGRISAIWVEVLVLESDAEKALEIKNRWLSTQDESEIPEWVCQCGETVDAGFAQCWSCMGSYEDSLKKSDA